MTAWTLKYFIQAYLIIGVEAVSTDFRCHVLVIVVNYIFPGPMFMLLVIEQITYWRRGHVILRRDVPPDLTTRTG